MLKKKVKAELILYFIGMLLLIRIVYPSKLFLAWETVFAPTFFLYMYEIFGWSYVLFNLTWQSIIHSMDVVFLARKIHIFNSFGYVLLAVQFIIFLPWCIYSHFSLAFQWYKSFLSLQTKSFQQRMTISCLVLFYQI